MKRGFCYGFSFFLMIFAALFNSGCSQPVLESADCNEARDFVKRLYSIHLDQGPNPDRKELESMRIYISGELFRKLSDIKAGNTDYLTQYEPFPKAFRVGACRGTPRGPEFDVLLFWRRANQNFEEKIIVSMIKEKTWVTEKVRKGNN